MVAGLARQGWHSAGGLVLAPRPHLHAAGEDGRRELRERAARDAVAAEDDGAQHAALFQRHGQRLDGLLAHVGARHVEVGEVAGVAREALHERRAAEVAHRVLCMHGSKERGRGRERE